MSAVEMAIRADGLSKRFGGVQALSGLNLEVAAGRYSGTRG